MAAIGLSPWALRQTQNVAGPWRARSTEPCVPGREGDEGQTGSRAGGRVSPAAEDIVHRAREGQESRPAARGPAPCCAALRSPDTTGCGRRRERDPVGRAAGQGEGRSRLQANRPQFQKKTSDLEIAEEMLGKAKSPFS